MTTTNVIHHKRFVNGKWVDVEQHERKQYFSKFHKRWVDLKPTDNEKELKKYMYRIRIKK